MIVSMIAIEYTFKIIVNVTHGDNLRDVQSSDYRMYVKFSETKRLKTEESKERKVKVI